MCVSLAQTTQVSNSGVGGGGKEVKIGAST